MNGELVFLWTGLLSYVLAGSLAVIALIFHKRPERTLLALLLAGLLVQGLSIGLRWQRLGHGPFNNMFEILTSNIWSLLLIFTLAYWRIRAIRPLAAVVLPITFIMMAWILLVPTDDTVLPPTYDTVWLFVHIGFAKIFLGSLLLSTGMAAVILLRGSIHFSRYLTRLPNNASLDELAYRFVILSLVFDSMMLIAGAIWAQDAWGRYWAWDPLETWSFITWVLLAAIIHLRITLKPAPRHNALIIVATFIVSFITFFGVPFFTQTPHKGVV